MKTKTRAKFIVSLQVPKGVSSRDMRAYIEEAVAIWKGQMDPDNPLFELDGRSVRVTRWREPKKPATA